MQRRTQTKLHAATDRHVYSCGGSSCPPLPTSEGRQKLKTHIKIDEQEHRPLARCASTPRTTKRRKCHSPLTACSKRSRSSPPSKPANSPPPPPPPPLPAPSPANAPINADRGSPTTTIPPLFVTPPPSRPAVKPEGAEAAADAPVVSDDDGGDEVGGGGGEGGPQLSRILFTMSRMTGWPGRQLAPDEHAAGVGGVGGDC